jgi:hypothetical protein
MMIGLAASFASPFITPRPELVAPSAAPSTGCDFGAVTVADVRQPEVKITKPLFQHTFGHLTAPPSRRAGSTVDTS